MPNLGEDEPLHKITLNIYEDDYLHLKSAYGDGWSVAVRLQIHEFVKLRKKHSKTLGDL